MDYQFKFCDNNKVICYGLDESDTIMTVWIEDGSICIDSQTDCDDIQIPVSVISKLILGAEVPGKGSAWTLFPGRFYSQNPSY